MAGLSPVEMVQQTTLLVSCDHHENRNISISITLPTMNIENPCMATSHIYKASITYLSYEVLEKDMALILP